MKIFNFEEFVLNEAYSDPINKYQVLVAFALSKIDSNVVDNSAAAARKVLDEYVPRLKGKKNLKTEIVPLVAPVIGLEPVELLELVKLCKSDPKKLGTSRKDRLVSSNLSWMTSIASSKVPSETHLSVQMIEKVLTGYLSNPNNPKYTGTAKVEEYDPSTLVSPFSEALRLTGTKTNVATKTYALFDFINNDANRESSLLEQIKKLEFSKTDTDHMIKVGLYNMKNISLVDYDCIVAPTSTSEILPMFLQNILDYINFQRAEAGKPSKEIKVIPDAFEKIPGKEILWDTEAIEKISDPKAKKGVLDLINRISKMDRGISLSRQVHVFYRKYLKNFMRLTPDGEKASGKILIVDDFTTGGSTIKEMRRLLGSNDFALTIFNVTGTKPDTAPKDPEKDLLEEAFLGIFKKGKSEVEKAIEKAIQEVDKFNFERLFFIPREGAVLRSDIADSLLKDAAQAMPTVSKLLPKLFKISGGYFSNAMMDIKGASHRGVIPSSFEVIRGNHDKLENLEAREKIKQLLNKLI